MSREKISGNGDLKALVVQMAEGNPGGITAMMSLIETNGALTGAALVLKLAEMNIRGGQIWVGFKDHCDSNIELFTQAIVDGDQMMVDTINRECYIPDLVEQYGEAYSHKAVRGEIHSE